MKILVINAIFALVIFVIGLMFLKGMWKNKQRTIKGLLGISYETPQDLKSNKLVSAANQLAFMICLLMTLLTLADGVVAYYTASAPNITLILAFIAIFLTWPIWVGFISIYKKKKDQDIPRIWPFPKNIDSGVTQTKDQ